MSEPLSRVARRVAYDPFFLAYPLAIYQAAHDLPDAKIASELGIDVGQLDRLRMCRVPVAICAMSASQVAATGTGCDAAALRRIVGDPAAHDPASGAGGDAQST
jgi:hypothetical protein